MNYLNIEGRQVRVTNLDKIFWPDIGATKGQMLDYYIKVSPLMLPHLIGRLVSLQRFPDGVAKQGFYQKNCPPGAPDWIQTQVLKRQGGKSTKYIVVQDLPTMVWLANSGVIEFHPWLSSMGSLDNPDYAVFDLDPMERFGLSEVTKIAAAIGELLQLLELKSGVKTSGATGIQIFVPLEPVYTYRQVRDFVELCCKLIQKQYAQWTTMERNVRDREGKIYLDYMQNAREKTIACAYSLRPQPLATFSAPLNWNQVYAGHVSLANHSLLSVLQGQMPDPWLAGINPQRLEEATVKLGKLL